MTIPRKILVVDDDEDIGEFIFATAASMGYDCGVASCAADFLNLLTPDTGLVLLDLVMPNTDGIELLRLLADRRTEASVILMSGIERRVIESAERMARSLGLDVVGHLQKPFRVAELEALLRTQHARLESRSPHAAVEEPFSPAELQGAVERCEFVLHYQPQVSLASNCVVAVEALARWAHPTRGMIFPDRFISHLEMLQLIDQLGWIGIERGLADLGRFRDAGGAIPRLSLNISAQSLHDLSLPDRIVSAADRHCIPAQKVTIEITESGLVQDLSEALDVLTRLRMKQIQLSIDDFGTGYSMMQQLQLVPATELKIDKSFVQGMHGNASYRVIVQKTIEIGHELGMQVVAEGVETSEQAEDLRSCGCDIAQGYLYCRPLPPEKLVSWLAEFRTQHSCV